MKLSFERSILSILCICLFSILTTLHAQDLDDVKISGKVVDSNGLAVVGATVKATSVQTRGGG